MKHGSFRIELPANGTIMIFAEARGFRFQGRLVEPSANTVELVLTANERAGRPDARDPGTRPCPRKSSGSWRCRCSSRTSSARTGPCGVTEYHTLQLLARIDPARAMEIAEKAKFVEPMMREGVKADAARSFLKETPDEAMALIESLEDPIGRYQWLPPSQRSLARVRTRQEAVVVNAGTGSCPGHQGPGAPPDFPWPDCRSSAGSGRDGPGDQDSPRRAERRQGTLHVRPRPASVAEPSLRS